MPPLSLLIKPVSGACNMRCRYCFYQDVMARRSQPVLPKMSFATLDNLVRRAFVFAEGSVSFAFQGGEPTLIGLDYFEELIRLQKKYNTRHIRVQNAIQTNGYDLSDAMLDFFAREHFLVGVSLDGDALCHDGMRKDLRGNPTYDRVLQTLRRMQAKNMEINILCVVTRETARRGKQVLEALQDFPFLQFIPCLDDLDGQKGEHALTAEGYLQFLRDSFEAYERRFMQGRPVSIRQFDNLISMMLGAPPENCAMAGRCGEYYLIESDGSVYPCDFYVLDEWCMGNVNRQGFVPLAKSPVAAEFRNQSLPVPEKCRNCRWYFLCRNGCKREREQDGVSKWCTAMSRFLDEYYERMQQIAAHLQA